MKYAFIGTWRMSYEAIKNNIEILKNEDSNGDAIVNAISYIEDFPYFKSVGYGGLPNEDCIVELDAGFMCGNTLKVGAVAGLRNIKNPIKLARHLSNNKYNSFLISDGAEKYARINNFEFKNMLSDRAVEYYNQKLNLLKNNHNLSPYDGHDTVGMITLDNKGNMFSATSTSGLFMKKHGRVGDSPLIGSGFYCISDIGGATATGLGEDIMKGCLSFKVVELLKSGVNVKDAPQMVIHDFHELMISKYGQCGSISIVALDKNGEWGIGTNCNFSFVVGNHNNEVQIYLASPTKDLKGINIKLASKEWLAAYDKARRGPIIYERN